MSFFHTALILVAFTGANYRSDEGNDLAIVKPYLRGLSNGGKPCECAPLTSSLPVLQYPLLEPVLDDLLPKKEPLIVAKW